MLHVIISRPKIFRREVLFWSPYHAAAAAAAASSRFTLNNSVDIGPRLLKSKIWILCKKSIFFFVFFSSRLIRLNSLIDN